MKKLLMIAAVLVLVLGLSLGVNAAEQAHPHEGAHCVCGGDAAGVGDHTACKDIDWTPLSQALKAAGLTMSTADFGKLPSGNYYLDADVTVTASSTIGSKADSLKTTPDTVKQLKLCLNGYNITRSGNGKVFGYLHMDSVLSICDCAATDGTVTGGSNNYGSIIYTYSRSTVNIYGGNYAGQAYASGGTFVIACDGCGDLDDNGKYEEADRQVADAAVMNLYNGTIFGSTVTGSGGTIQLYHTAGLNMYGGTVIGGAAGANGGAINGGKGVIRIAGGNIIGGTATGTGGAIYSTGTVYITGGTMTGGTDKAGAELVQVIGNDGKPVGTYTSFEEGLSKAQSTPNVWLRLLQDVETDAAISGTLYLDLSGHSLKGIHIEGVLYGMDSATDGYEGANAGILTPASGKPQTYTKLTRRYLCIEEDGSFAFHRFYLGITKITLKPGTYGMGYKAVFAGSEQVQAALSGGNAFGYKLWLTEDAVLSRGYGADQFENKQELTLRIDNFLDPALTAEENAKRAEMDVHAVAYLRFADGTELQSAQVCYDLRQMVELADASYAGYTTAQKNALDTLSAEFSMTMLGWDIANTHHAKGTVWQQVDSAAFMKKLTLYSSTNSVYRLAAGHYVLTEDVDIGSKRIRIHDGVTVSICLNGHTLKGSNRLFEQYGTLNICDCHVSEKEGCMISTQAGETATYASIAYCRYNSVTNIYGGHLQATGKVNSAGLFAVSHDGSGTNLQKPAAVMNIYGGTISGGQAYDNGGLISIWNDGKVNIYGGELYGGTAGKRGGGIDINKGRLQIYGGKIYNNTAGKGGGIYAGADFTVAGGTITGNSASDVGGGVYLIGSTATLRGTAQITDNAGSDLFMEYSGSANIDGLMPGAKVDITPVAMTVLGTNEQAASYVTCEKDGYSIKKVYNKIVVWADGTESVRAVEGFQVGFGEVNITPETIDGMPLAGYSNPTERLAVDEGRKEYDDIKAQSVAITDEEGETVILIFADLITCNASIFDHVVNAISVATGVPEDHIFLNFSHSHSVPSVTTDVPAVVEYNRTLPNLFAQSALQAMNDRRPATMETGSFEVQKTVNGKTQYYNFYRHYSYEEDGIVKYFGDQFGNATYNSTTKPIRDADHTMHLVRFVRDGKDILMSNWRIHPHFTGGESKYLLSADAIGTIRYFMEKKLPDTHFVYFQGAAGNMNETSRLTSSRVQASQVQNHGLAYVAYGETVAQIILDNLDCLESREIGLLQVDHYDYLAKADTPTDAEYANAKAIYDVFVKETEGMTLSQQNDWVRDYCAQHPEYDYVSAFQLSFIVNRRYKQNDTELPLNVVTLGKSFALFTGPFEMWDSISMEVEEKSPFDTTFCLGYSMDHQHYLVYYPEYLDSEDGVPYVSYESENRHFAAPDTVLDMIDYWTKKLNEFYNK